MIHNQPPRLVKMVRPLGIDSAYLVPDEKLRLYHIGHFGCVLVGAVPFAVTGVLATAAFPNEGFGPRRVSLPALVILIVAGAICFGIYRAFIQVLVRRLNLIEVDSPAQLSEEEITSKSVRFDRGLRVPGLLVAALLILWIVLIDLSR